MNLDVKWSKPLPLVDGDSINLIYTIHDLDEWQGVPGVYMFARIFNDTVFPLYIGKAEDIGKRAGQHFKNNTQLMNGIKKSRNGEKVFVPGRFTPKPGQSTKKCIKLIEAALIDHALTEGYNLLNIQGTKTPAHKINFSGNIKARNVTGKSLSFKA